MSISDYIFELFRVNFFFKSPWKYWHGLQVLTQSLNTSPTGHERSFSKVSKLAFWINPKFQINKHSILAKPEIPCIMKFHQYRISVSPKCRSKGYTYTKYVNIFNKFNSNQDPKKPDLPLPIWVNKQYYYYFLWLVSGPVSSNISQPVWNNSFIFIIYNNKY